MPSFLFRTRESYRTCPRSWILCSGYCKSGGIPNESKGGIKGQYVDSLLFQVETTGAFGKKKDLGSFEVVHNLNLSCDGFQEVVNDKRIFGICLSFQVDLTTLNFLKSEPKFGEFLLQVFLLFVEENLVFF